MEGEREREKVAVNGVGKLASSKEALLSPTKISPIIQFRLFRHGYKLHNFIIIFFSINIYKVINLKVGMKISLKSKD